MGKSAAGWRSAFAYSDQEMAAKSTGLQVVFGAVLGFVLAGAEALDPVRFAVLLLLTAGCVVSIVSIAGSERRVLFIIAAVAVALAIPAVMQAATGAIVPPKLVPTLLMWTLIQTISEFVPRRAKS